MPEEAAPPEAPEKAGTPLEPKAAPPEAPAEGQPESPEEIDWKQRYEDLRPEADRRGTLIADIEGRNGPERRAQALAEHARIELEEEVEEEPEEDFDLPPDPLDEIEAIKQNLAERDEMAQAEEFDQLETEYTERTVEELEAKESLKLSDEEYELVVNYGLAHRDPHDGKPDYEGGFQALKAAEEATKKRIAEYAASKDEAALAPAGSAGEKKIDMRDKDARQKLGREVFEAAERSKQN